MSEYVLPKLEKRVIPLTRDCDRVISLRRKDSNGAQQNWGADVYMLIDVDRWEATRIDGVVSGPDVSIRIEAADANEISEGTTWRIVVSESGSPSLETPIMVGTFERNDGER